VAATPLWEYSCTTINATASCLHQPGAGTGHRVAKRAKAMNAVGSGTNHRQGFLQGTQIRPGSLPALWTDFPFAVGPGMGLPRCA